MGGSAVRGPDMVPPDLRHMRGMSPSTAVRRVACGWVLTGMFTCALPPVVSATGADLKELLARASTLSNGSVPTGQAHAAIAVMIALRLVML